jgi:hypothetical protein
MYKAAVDIAAALERVALRHGDYHVRIAEAELAGGGQRFRQVAGVAFGGAAAVPVEDHGPLFVGQAEVVLELAMAVDGFPWGHAALFNGALNVFAPGHGGFVGVEREGADVAFAVALLAFVLKDAGDIPRVRHLSPSAQSKHE